ncbi:MAG: hypothetical protein RBR32_13090 [Bacteroidales bacterium]|nr:hypothetical protein [Bacteroidales bacterium]
MSKTNILELTTASVVSETEDYIPMVDVSDTTESGDGTTKKATVRKLLKDKALPSGDIVGTSDVQTLGGKTLTSPVITDIDITGGSATDIDITGGSISESTNVVEVLKKVYPVGCIYTSTVSTNPNTLFGFGTWSEYGQGRVLVGKSAEAEFDTAGKTGGLKENRQGFPWVGVNSSSFQDSGASYTASVLGDLNTWLTGGGSSTTSKSTAVRNVGGEIRTNGTTPTEVTHYRYTTPNLQPYIVVYFWKREN